MPGADRLGQVRGRRDRDAAGEHEQDPGQRRLDGEHTWHQEPPAGRCDHAEGGPRLTEGGDGGLLAAKVVTYGPGGHGGQQLGDARRAGVLTAEHPFHGVAVEMVTHGRGSGR
jgi:hypothetical protein